MRPEKTILAIDPGYERLGIAVVKEDKARAPLLVHSECFQTATHDDFSIRLALIGERISSLITEYTPTHLAIELLYMTKNQKTAMRVAEVRGAIIYLAAAKQLTICEYTPLEIKVAVAGDGRADKKQVIAMVPRLITISEPIRYDDEYDAIATGLTCLASIR